MSVPWPVVTLNEVCTTQYGYTASAEEEDVGPKFLRITDIVPDVIDWENVPHCVIDEKNISRYKLEAGDIVIARTGNTTGYAKLIRDEVNSVFASYLVRLKLDSERCYPGFVGRLIESNVYKAFVNSVKGGAAQGNANAKTLTLFRFSLPPIKAQKRISEVLEQYDDLIENNRRRIQLLEESARLLYREWFVLLRFPGHEHVKVVEGVPEGWHKSTLDEFVTLNYGKALTADDRVDGDNLVYGSSGIVGTHNKYLVTAPGIVVGRKGNVGSVYWVTKNYWPIDTVYYVNSEQSNIFIYYALKSLSFINTDGAVPGLNRDFAYSRPFLMPDAGVIDQFLAEANPIHEQIQKLTDYNAKLVEACDLLLPRLMNGDIAV